jgi:hypothetical protein
MMTRPTVIELPLALEPVTPDPFIEGDPGGRRAECAPRPYWAGASARREELATDGMPDERADRTSPNNCAPEEDEMTQRTRVKR